MAMPNTGATPTPYDAWGNLTNKAKIPSACGGELLSAPALANNQLSGYGYDAENRIATVTTPQGVFTYTYDSDGNRVKKSGGGSGTLYWYMTPGIVAESDLAGTLKSEYIFSMANASPAAMSARLVVFSTTSQTT